jgi:hypothetical protein
MAAPAYADVTRRDAIEQVACEIVAGMRRAMLAHGRDPDSVAILVLGIDAAVREITKQLSPLFRQALVEQLSKERVR